MTQFTEVEFRTPLYEQAVALRDRVLRKPLGLEFSAADLAAEGDQLHFALIEAELPTATEAMARNAIGCVVGCVIARPLGGGRYQLRQMAIDAGRQGQGLGRRLLEQTEQHLAALGAQELMLHARDIAAGFYKKLGYQPVGDPFMEVTILHYEMTKRLA